MRVDQALSLSVGDKLIDCFSEDLVLNSKQLLYNSDGQIAKVKLTVVTTYLLLKIYDCSELYLPDLYEESDEEKSWVDWASKHLDRQDDISIIKYAYLQGFANGFTYKRKALAEEQLQK